MESINRTYLVNTQNLMPAERVKTKELLNISCWTSVPLAKNPHIFMAYTAYSADEFAAVLFPKCCAVTDITGHDLLTYR